MIGHGDGPIPAEAGIIFMRAHKTAEDCWVWEGAASRGHGMLTGGRYVHREVYIAYFGEIPAGFVVAHKCDNGLCVNPAHLEAITPQQNIRDAVTRKRYVRARYSDEDIKDLRAGTITRIEFSRKFGLKMKTVYNIKLGHKAKWRG